MLKFILKRLGSTVIVLFGASVLVFALLVHSGDPLADLRESTADNREFLMEQRAQQLHLELPWTDEYFKPWYERYWLWFRGLLGCFVGACDFGTDVNGRDVTGQILQAAEQSLRLVFIATMTAIILGILIGIISAIRQYSLFDYIVSFVVFLFFSLPVFWGAIIGKEWLAIRFNNWMADPQFTWGNILFTAVLLAIAIPLVTGGSPLRRLMTGGIMFAFTCAVMPLMNQLNYAYYPRLGPVVILVFSVALAFGLTALFAGLRHRRVLYIALGVAGLGILAYYGTWGLLREAPGGYLLLLGLFALTIALCIGLARAFGGYIKGPATAVSVVLGILISGMVLLDHYMYSWPQLLSVKSRPIRTIGSNFQEAQATGDFWISSLDHLTQLWIPSLVMMLVSLATYTRYTRSSMLEVSKQDYMRTARAKGVPERTVYLKHGFRNALIPLATIVAFDFAGLVSGAVIVERVFGWRAMGTMFIEGLQRVDPAPVMAVVIFTGFVAVLFNLIADVLYAVLDPRIRV